MPNYTGMRRVLRDHDHAPLLRDEFHDTLAAGSVDGTPATPAGGLRAVTDTNTKISVGSGVLDFATGAAANDGAWYDSRGRLLGRVLFGTLTPSNTSGQPNFGWDSNGSGAINDAMRFLTGGVLQIIPNGGTAIAVGAYTATTYRVAAVMRTAGIYWYIKGGAFANWTHVWTTSAGTSAGFPAIIAGDGTTVFTADLPVVTHRTFIGKPLAYDTFTRSDGALGSSETTGSDAQSATARSWTGATWAIVSGKAVNTPTAGAEALTDGGFENWDSATDLTSWVEYPSIASTINREASIIHGGTYACRIDIDASNSAAYIRQIDVITVGTWYHVSGWFRSASGTPTLYIGIPGAVVSPTLSTTYSQYFGTGRATGTYIQIVRSIATSNSLYCDDISVIPLTLSTLLASCGSIATPDVLASADLTITAGTQAGVVTNLDSAASPANFLLAYHDGTTAKLDKCVAGTYTNLISAAAAYSASATLRVITYTSGSDLKVRLYYNNALIGTEQTVSDAGIVSNTIHGLFSTYDGNTIDNFTVFPRGTEGQYEELSYL